DSCANALPAANAAIAAPPAKVLTQFRMSILQPHVAALRHSLRVVWKISRLLHCYQAGWLTL
ncbi:MAG: hypothetical protein AAF687_13585, partial [Pseudomonadota bacterium]